MSNRRQTTRPTVTTDAPSTNEETEVLEGEIIDNTTPAPTGRVKNFLKKYKTWLVGVGAAAAGFVAHALLTSEDESCACDPEPAEDEMYLEVTPEDQE